MGTELGYQPLLGDSVLMCIPKSALEDIYLKIHSRMSLTIAVFWEEISLSGVYSSIVVLSAWEHFSGQGHSASDLHVNILQGRLQDTQQHRVAEQRLIAEFCTREDGPKRDLGLMSHY
eukprot:g25522.t1